MMKHLRRFDLPLHPFLAATLPVLWLGRTNLQSIYADMLIRPWVLSLLLAALLLAVLRVVTRSWISAAPAATVLVLALLQGGAIGTPGFVGALVAAALLGGAGRKWPDHWSQVGTLLNVATLFLVAFNLYLNQQAAAKVLSPEIAPTYLQTDEVQHWSTAPAEKSQLPDVYYLLLDGMARLDTLEHLYGVDTTEWRRRFSVLGFSVAERSYANYPQTALSVASSMNMDRLDEFLRFPYERARDRRPVGRTVAHSRVRKVFESHGYQMVHYPSGYPFTRIADVQNRRSAVSASLVEYELLSETALTPLQEWVGHGPSDVGFAMRRAQLGYIFDDLPKLAARASSSPRFVFAHVLAPHPPFVFGRHGEALRSRAEFSYRDGDHWKEIHPGDDDYRTLYRDQALYILERTLTTVSKILKNSPRPVWIVVQGDHGPGSQLEWKSPSRAALQERMATLVAIRPPKGVVSGVYPELTPRNVFRVVLDGVFHTHTPLAEDRIFYSSIGRPYMLRDLGVIQPVGATETPDDRPADQ